MTLPDALRWLADAREQAFDCPGGFVAHHSLQLAEQRPRAASSPKTKPAIDMTMRSKGASEKTV
jgi:hypothetical protein